MKRLAGIIFTSMIILGLGSCEFESPESYSLSFDFFHAIGEDPLSRNQLIYTNEAGNTYSVENLRYVISDIRVLHSNGAVYGADGYHYVDLNNASTQEIPPAFYVEPGQYTAIGFVFGLDEGLNIDGVHEPLNQLNWNWPIDLGGGYHFMQLEGKYQDSQGTELPYAAHLGTARKITSGADIYEPNYVVITIDTTFSIAQNSRISLEMNIEEWFKNPNTWDFNTWNTGIMGDYNAQISLKENGSDVFSVKEVKADL